MELVEKWLIEYAAKYRFTRVLHEFCTREHAPQLDHYQASQTILQLCLTDVIVSRDDREMFSVPLQLMTLLSEDLFQSLDYKRLAKISSGLKILELIHLLKHKSKMALPTLNRYFPRHGSQIPQCDDPDFNSAYRRGHQRFRKLFLSLIANEEQRKLFLQGRMRQEFGPSFVARVHQMVKEVVHEVEQVLPLNPIERLILEGPCSPTAQKLGTYHCAAIELLLDFLYILSTSPPVAPSDGHEKNPASNKSALTEEKILELMTLLRPLDGKKLSRSPTGFSFLSSMADISSRPDTWRTRLTQETNPATPEALYTALRPRSSQSQEGATDHDVMPACETPAGSHLTSPSRGTKRKEPAGGEGDNGRPWKHQRGDDVISDEDENAMRNVLGSRHVRPLARRPGEGERRRARATSPEAGSSTSPIVVNSQTENRLRRTKGKVYRMKSFTPKQSSPKAMSPCPDRVGSGTGSAGPAEAARGGQRSSASGTHKGDTESPSPSVVSPTPPSGAVDHPISPTPPSGAVDHPISPSSPSGAVDHSGSPSPPSEVARDNTHPISPSPPSGVVRDNTHPISPSEVLRENVRRGQQSAHASIAASGKSPRGSQLLEEPVEKSATADEPDDVIILSGSSSEDRLDMCKPSPRTPRAMGTQDVELSGYSPEQCGSPPLRRSPYKTGCLDIPLPTPRDRPRSRVTSRTHESTLDVTSSQEGVGGWSPEQVNLVSSSSSSGDTYSESQGQGRSQGQGHSQGHSQSQAHSQTQSQGHSQSQAHSQTQRQGQGRSQGHSQIQSQGHGHSQTQSQGHGHSHSPGHTKGQNLGHTQGQSLGHTQRQSLGHTQRQSLGHTQRQSLGHTQGQSPGHSGDQARSRGRRRESQHSVEEDFYTCRTSMPTPTPSATPTFPSRPYSSPKRHSGTHSTSLIGLDAADLSASSVGSMVEDSRGSSIDSTPDDRQMALTRFEKSWRSGSGGVASAAQLPPIHKHLRDPQVKLCVVKLHRDKSLENFVGGSRKLFH